MAKELFCPNCGPGHALTGKSDGTSVCASCQGTFTPGPEPKVVGVGEFDQLKERVSKLEASKAVEPAKPAEPVESSTDPKTPEVEDV